MVFISLVVFIIIVTIIIGTAAAAAASPLRPPSSQPPALRRLLHKIAQSDQQRWVFDTTNFDRCQMTRRKQSNGGGDDGKLSYRFEAHPGPSGKFGDPDDSIWSDRAFTGQHFFTVRIDAHSYSHVGFAFPSHVNAKDTLFKCAGGDNVRYLSIDSILYAPNSKREVGVLLDATAFGTDAQWPSFRVAICVKDEDDDNLCRVHSLHEGRCDEKRPTPWFDIQRYQHSADVFGRRRGVSFVFHPCRKIGGDVELHTGLPTPAELAGCLSVDQRVRAHKRRVAEAEACTFDEIVCRDSHINALVL